ncbi:phosphatase PAP2 family protein [Halorussus aquaticus]|uniref:Phosphatase PAP2 family protein n=1 Tax=Halorussus aquaticus TaxID=2953748 RepID=A0ABD5Q6H3_9EURY|nr:phosphatase PAP2 family protein [Halorussus aquaticus]
MTGRSIGVAVAFDRHLPPAVRELFGLLTNVGDVGVLLAAVALCYWFGDRRRGAVALAGVLGASSLTLALKGLFALPRPPTTVRVARATGYGFPSGHALSATVAFALLALALDRGSHRRRAAVAAAAVAVVCLSRVVIGVHYAVDVVVGVGAGLAYVAALVGVRDWRPRRAFAVAGVAAAAALLTNGLTPDATAAAAGVLGAGAAWTAFEVPSEASVRPLAAFGGLAVLGALGYAGNALELTLPAVFGLNLLVPAGIVALPLAVERVRKEESATVT